ncbi:hypothetical protein ABZ615_11315 [Streptomyces sp. NPDC007325]|uniref:hypothetical protein n=1 Tax=Streptomyces sp. NPDC007325 TaxID=3154588 RepID=UPI0033D52335
MRKVRRGAGLTIRHTQDHFCHSFRSLFLYLFFIPGVVLAADPEDPPVTPSQLGFYAIMGQKRARF